MEKKYELISSDKPGLYRIKALRDFSNVKKGDIGGYVSSEDNLSHEGLCWIYDEAIVKDHAYICDNTLVCSNAKISGDVLVDSNTIISGNSNISSYAYIHNARISGDVNISGQAVIDSAFIDSHIYISGDVWISMVRLSGDAVIKSKRDFIIFKNWWSSGRYFIWTRSDDMWSVGCFYGTGLQLITKAYQDSEISGREYKRIVDYVESIKPYLNDLYK